MTQNSLVLTMNDLGGALLWQATVNLSGTVSDPATPCGSTVSKPPVGSDGTWTASNVPVNDGGTASFSFAAYAPGEPQPPAVPEAD